MMPQSYSTINAFYRNRKSHTVYIPHDSHHSHIATRCREYHLPTEVVNELWADSVISVIISVTILLHAPNAYLSHYKITWLCLEKMLEHHMFPTATRDKEEWMKPK